MLIVCGMMEAQNSVTHQINAIMQDEHYIYGEATMAVRDSAVSRAARMLHERVMEWIAMQNGIDLNDECLKLADTIYTMRASLYRAFVYMDKRKLMNLSDEGISEESVPEGESMPVAPAVQPPQMSPADAARQALEQIVNVRSFFKLRDTMMPFIERGIISEYGKCLEEDPPIDGYLIVYDPAGNIKAVLGKGEDTRRNLHTDKDDSFDNYFGCGAIWFKMKGY